ncbi:D-arabinose 5-phosphate isomerase, partial [Salmonella enterica subsp. enterica serovar Poona]
MDNWKRIMSHLALQPGFDFLQAGKEVLDLCLIHISERT